MPTRRRDLAITAEQFDTFVDLVGASEDSVMWRLQHDPGLVSIAVAAADARRARKKSGRNAMILGFSTVGLGATVGILGVLASGPGYPGESPQPNEQSAKGNSTMDVIGLVLVGLGLFTATYGIMTVSARTDIETEAVSRYEGSPSASPGRTEGKALSRSLCSFTF